MIDDKMEKHLMSIAREVRRIIVSTPLGHMGGCLSMTDLAVALYFYKMKHDPQNPEWEERDQLILGKAHCAGALYPCLGLSGYFPKEKYFPLYGGTPAWPDANGWRTLFQGHTDRWCTPGIDFSGGSLGQGLGFAIGLAYGALIKATKDVKGFPMPSNKVYCITGDGEVHEGLIWESAMFASHYRLSNLVNIMDYNNYGMSDPMSEELTLEPFVEKWKSFGWYVVEVNGHDMRDICRVLDQVDVIAGDRPKCIIAHTIKGKGVPPVESDHIHGGYRFTPEELKEALETYLKPLPDPFVEE